MNLQQEAAYPVQQGFAVGREQFVGQAAPGMGRNINQNQVPQSPVGMGRAQEYGEGFWGRQGVGVGARAEGVKQGIGMGARAEGFRQGMGMQRGGGLGMLGGEIGGGQMGANHDGSIPKEVLDRLASFEKRLNFQSARTGIEAELRRQQAQINPERNPGLFAQMDIASTIYSAPRSWKGPIALMGGLSSVLKVPTSKLAFLGDELVSTGLQKCREAGEELTDEQTAAIENFILETFRTKKARAEELMARNPEWAKKG
jgi:hypothetical protein